MKEKNTVLAILYEDGFIFQMCTREIFTALTELKVLLT